MKILTYFSSSALGRGSIVRIRVRGRQCYGLVVSSQSASSSKQGIKSGKFSLKSLDRSCITHALDENFLGACERYSSITLKDIAKVLESFCQIQDIVETRSVDNTRDLAVRWNGSSDEKAMRRATDNFDDLMARIEIESGRALVCCSNISKSKYMSRLFEKRGVAQFVIHSGLSVKKRLQTIKQLNEVPEGVPLVVICTPGYVYLPGIEVSSVTTFGDSTKASHKSTQTDFKMFCNLYAKEMGVSYLEFGPAPSLCFLSSLNKESKTDSEKQMNAYGPISNVLPHTERPSHTSAPSNVLGESLRGFLQVNTDTKCILVSGRRGHSPLTVCQDCGQTISCGMCDSPLVLHAGGGERNYLCHSCESPAPPVPARCASCSSWRLVTIGVGVEKVREEFETYYPDSNVYILSSDHAKTSASAQKIVRAFSSSIEPACLITTSMISGYLELIESDCLCSIVSMDHLLMIPDYAIGERVLRFVLALRQISGRPVSLQTRKPDSPLFKSLDTSLPSVIYENELRKRKKYCLPPENVTIRVQSSVPDTIDSLLVKFGVLGEGSSNLSISRVNSSHVSLSLPANEWPHKEISNILRSMNDDIELEVDLGEI